MESKPGTSLDMILELISWALVHKFDTLKAVPVWHGASGPTQLHG